MASTRRARRPSSSSIRRRWSVWSRRRNDAPAVSSPATPQQRVWDPLLRVLHWTLVAAVALSWVSTSWPTRDHEAVGYVALASVALRLLWGFVGPRHARFAQFVRGPRRPFAYTSRLLRGPEPRYLGHNPPGAWMAIALLASLPAPALPGWPYRPHRVLGPG